MIQVNEYALALYPHRKTFSLNHSLFSLEQVACSDLSKYFTDSNYDPASRYLHSAACLPGKMIVIGGVTKYLANTKTMCFNLYNHTWEYFYCMDRKYHRNSHGCTVFEGSVYIFGGSMDSIPLNDLRRFCLYKRYWFKVNCVGYLPTPRYLMLFTSVSNQYIFLYAGINLQNECIFNTAHLYKSGRWKSLEISHQPSYRIMMGSAVCGSRLFMFGGEGPTKDGIVDYEELFELAIDEVELTVDFRLAKILPGATPGKRAAIGMVSINKYFFVVYGGKRHQPQSIETLFDLWVYDVFESQWISIELRENHKPVHDFSLAVRNNYLYIFGGLLNSYSTNRLFKITFDEVQSSTTVCTCPHNKYCVKYHEKQFPYYLEISLGFLYNLSLQIHSPFRAIEMIIDSIKQMLSATSCHISSPNHYFNYKKLSYLLFKFETTDSFNNGEFMMSKFKNNYTYAQFLNLRKSALRLGKTVLIVNSTTYSRRVMLFSIDNKLNPDFYLYNTYYAYIEDFYLGLISKYGNSNKQSILKQLSFYIDNPYIPLAVRNSTQVLIFSTNIIPLSGHCFSYELSFSEADAHLYCNQAEIKVLNQLGYNLELNAEFSLASYLRIATFERNISVAICYSEPIVINPYLGILEDYWKKVLISKLPLKSVPYVLQADVFICDYSCIIEENNGILVYCDNRLYDRLECPFGSLISSRFYKRHYKQRMNLWAQLGVIVMSPELQLNSSGTHFYLHSKYLMSIGKIIDQLVLLAHNYQQIIVTSTQDYPHKKIKL